MAEKQEKTAAELKAEHELMMAKAALKNAITSFSKKENLDPPEELIEYWDELKTRDWKNHLKLFERELNKLDHPKFKAILFDLGNYLKDVQKSNPRFKRSKAEVLLMMAIGQIDVEEFIEVMTMAPENREKLDRKIEKQIKRIDWDDDQDLKLLDDLTLKLENPKIKKAEVETIDKEIDAIEKRINGRKEKRDLLALKLVEWKARGNIDIAGEDGSFKLEA